jgi:acyl carrier protein
MATEKPIKEIIRKFLTEDDLYSGSIPKDLSDTFPLIDSSALDSLGVFNLVVFLESRFNIRIEISDLSQATFGNLDSLERFVRSKVGAHGAGK